METGPYTERPTMTGMTFSERYTAACAEYAEAIAAAEEYYEREWRAEMARMLAADKAEGRKRTVAMRRCVAMDTVKMRPEYRAMHDRVEAAYEVRKTVGAVG
jgi:hypothetical protein